ncbi:hypothetical protein QMK19_26580 [Streptomyces sp. H10-C2]|uniref:DUF6817 domain-containing protein n=1 Tax=unclassified Streptomyces TaxID=2593676 RepID=UPI0024BBBA33|nr:MULTISPECIES: hypothetical protein [unclassified Streptomyces]MDJ0343623.1 hypothetical protein [Streptomyces sp. PH10-H1]MDJ0373129.1 hypothetical protein [Streptomyces sp. H10-C2]
MEETASGPAVDGQKQDDPEGAVNALLETLGAARIEHPGGTLLKHLQRVRELLVGWGVRRDLQLAGLCHAFYGTDGFPTVLIPVASRSELVRHIGVDAEELVYFYASCDRKASYSTLASDDAVFRDRFTGTSFSPSLQQRRDFAILTAANELDIVRVSPAYRDDWGGELLQLLTLLRPLLSDEAWAATEETLG